MPASTMFDWQALDARTVVIWAAPADDLYEVALAEPIDDLNGSPAGSIELVDGDHDGYICDAGLDSIALWTEPLEEPENPETLLGTADVFYVDRLNAVALADRLSTHADTLGPRANSRLDD